MQYVDGMGLGILGRVGESTESRVDIVRVAERLIRPGVVRLVEPEAVCGTAMYMVRGGRPYILVSSALSIERRRHSIAHEIAEWLIGSDSEDREDLCNRLAASLLMPRAKPLVHLAGLLCMHGIARRYQVEQASAALRVGEVTRRAVAVSVPGRALRQSGAALDWKRALSAKSHRAFVSQRCTDSIGKIAHFSFSS